MESVSLNWFAISLSNIDTWPWFNRRYWQNNENRVRSTFQNWNKTKLLISWNHQHLRKPSFWPTYFVSSFVYIRPCRTFLAVNVIVNYLWRFSVIVCLKALNKRIVHISVFFFVCVLSQLRCQPISFLSYIVIHWMESWNFNKFF